MTEESKELVDIAAELEADAKQIATALSGAPIISIKGGRFTFPDDHVESGPVDMVVIAMRTNKQLWAKPYNAEMERGDNGIICAAVSDPQLNFSMQAFASAPSLKAHECDQCPENKWERNAKGKRIKVGGCKDVVTFAVMAPDMKDPNIYMLRGSSTMIKEAKAAVQEMKIRYGHPVKAVCTFGFAPTQRGALRLSVKVAGPNPNWQEHGKYLHQAVSMVEAPPRWYNPDPKDALPSAPDNEPEGKVSGGRKGRSAAA